MKYYTIKYDRINNCLILTLQRQYGVSWTNVLQQLKRDFWEMAEEIEYDKATGNWSCEITEDIIKYFIKQGWKCPVSLLKKFSINTEKVSILG